MMDTEEDVVSIEPARVCTCGRALVVAWFACLAAVMAALITALVVWPQWRMQVGCAVAATVAVLTLLSTGYLWYVSRERRGYDHA
jgi:uncharacterized membrane protein YqjE